MKNFISIYDVSDLSLLVQQALHYKSTPLADKQLGAGKRIGLLFFNPSLRTRVSTQVAAQQLGMEAIVFNQHQDGWALAFEDNVVMNGNSVEHVKEAARVLSRYVDILAIRSFPGLKDRDEDYRENIMRQFMNYASVPIVSLESATLHPLQSFADLITIQETWKKNYKPNVVLTWAPHVKPLPQCVANSFSQWMTGWGECNFTVVQPKGFELEASFTKGATMAYDQEKALKDADYIYVKNWSAYTEYGQILENGGDWMLTNKKLATTRQAKVMHCLPVRRNVELSDEVLDSDSSLVIQQAENRIWAAQAVLSQLLKTI